MTPRLIDLYCGAGGAAMGYHRAGFEVVGVDLVAQPEYPFAFVHGDALRRLPELLEGAAAIHASPPCKAHTTMGAPARNRPHLFPQDRDLIAETRAALAATGLPYIIENVPGSPLLGPLILCGSSFDLGVRRHRHFELSGFAVRRPLCRHAEQGPVVGVYGNPHGSNGAAPGMLPGDLATWQEAMGTPWITDVRRLSQAIPPPYTEHIGRALVDALEGP